MLRLVSFALCLVVFACFGSVKADDGGCYTSGSVAGIVIATVVVTLVMGGLAVASIWYLWKQRKAGYADNKPMEKPMVCPPMSPDKQLIVRESNDYAFDNPYFKDDETDNANPDTAEKGESGFRTDNGDITPAQNAKASNGTTGHLQQHHKKSRPFSSLPFHSVFHPSGKKQQRATMDDTYISKHLERITVPLRGHDFTGLGFNICGNMRDGIFVKDVLHRGPASESGKIKAGDRIVGVTVSFGAMVYEDALTILSYASPYDVRLEIEKAPAKLCGVPHLPPSSPKRLEASTSFKSNVQRRLFHPLYRSQSIDDLTQIGKDGFGIISTSGSQRDSNPSATPKRSQSVEASNGGLKTRPPFILKSDESKSSDKGSKGSRKSSTSSCESTAKMVTPTEKTPPASNQKEAPCEKKESKSARYRAEQVNLKSEAPAKTAPPIKPARELPEEKLLPANDKPTEETTKEPHDINVDPSPKPGETQEPDSDIEKPTAPPRKSSAPKRKAPAPPPTPASKTEISAVVHRVDDLPKDEEATETDSTAQEVESAEFPPPPPPISELPPPADDPPLLLTKESLSTKNELEAVAKELPVFSSTEKIADPGLGSSDNSSLASSEHKMDKDDQNASPGKRKASSLGDLTKLERGGNKKTSTSSAILERAVSLDFQQSLPGENLTKQKKILQAPTFEDDYEEDMEDLTEINGAGLKRWDDALDKVFTRMPNGSVQVTDDLIDEEENAPLEFHAKLEINQTEKIEKSSADSLTEMIINKTSSDLEDDSPIGELPLPNSQVTTTLLTSTPVKKVIEVKDLLKDDDDDDLDDVPYLASAKQQNREDPSTKHPAKNSGSSTLFSPVTISIPVIKPDLTQFEKLPSPPPASTHPTLEPGWRVTKTQVSDDGTKTSLEKISVQSLYRPFLPSKETNSADESVSKPSTEKMVNGNESDTSEHYSTAQENTSTSSVETSTLSVTLSSPVTKEVTVKAPSTIAGFAKTLIIPGPNEVENLLSLAAEPNTPPPLLEPPSKSTENE